MRRFLVWYLPITAALAAAIFFGAGFYSFLRGDTGTPVSAMPSTRVASSAPRQQIVPIILGDSLARGTGDESGLGIGGRFVDELKRRHVDTKSIVNIAVNGARTRDLVQQLTSHNVQTLVAQSNVVIVSIGGNDLWGDNNWRNAAPRNPEKVMNGVLDNVTEIVRSIRGVNPTGRVFVIGLYNPFVTTPFGKLLTPFVNHWNALLVQRFSADPNVVIVQTSDIFAYRDRLSLDRFHPNDEGYSLIARRIADDI
ncbi:MAG TPA: GDSL-type esterase/lipase family protein [Thermoanaerobaculia bacterium]|jgi:lysophospholipase L1-like esterase|nr:GDSL-type esterase/lipase family protein [Thermoanaerobaculia bacterium]